MTAARVERASEAHSALLVELFERSDVPCHCQYFGFAGDHRDWQNRCANERSSNRQGLVDDLAAGRMTAWVALDATGVVGWLRLGSPRELHKTYDNRLYRGLPCFTGERRDVLAVACFLIAPGVRRQGIASALLSDALAWAKAQGKSSIEAFPRGASDVSDGEQWTGPLALYERAGFVRVHDFGPYPVLRLDLRA